MIPAWLEDLAIAVGEEELRRALMTAIDAGDLGEHKGHRTVLMGIVCGPIAHRSETRRVASLGKRR